MARRSLSAFQGFDEGELRFSPTYKFDVGTLTYDTGAKDRTPAWCISYALLVMAYYSWHASYGAKDRTSAWCILVMAF